VLLQRHYFRLTSISFHFPSPGLLYTSPYRPNFMLFFSERYESYWRHCVTAWNIIYLLFCMGVKLDRSHWGRNVD
jgi:hypothetical protein